MRVWYRPDGRVFRYVSFPRGDEDYGLAFVDLPEDGPDPGLCYVKDGSLHLLPHRPSPDATFDPQAGAWVIP